MNDNDFIQWREWIREQLDLTVSQSDEEIYKRIEEQLFLIPESRYLTALEKKEVIQHLFHAFRGLDRLQPLLDDTSISEIMINSHDEIFIERNGEITKSALKFENQEKLEDIIQKIVSKVNRIVNESSPIVDARLEDGSRINIVLPPLALKGPTMTIRKFPDLPLTLEQLVEKGSITEEVRLFLVKVVKAKYNLFIGGGTGSGKTTFLNALSDVIPTDERIITIEDSAELQIRNVPNLVSLETRNSNTEGKGRITISDLIRASLRMRPNRIIVGEVRGPEAMDMLQAMNTGHDGSFSTGHANTTTDMLSRLETMVLSGANVPIEVVRNQICSAIDIMIHISRLRDRSRRVTEISEITGVVNGQIKLNSLYSFIEEPIAEADVNKRDNSDNPIRVIGKLQATRNTLQRVYKLQMAGIKEV